MGEPFGFKGGRGTCYALPPVSRSPSDFCAFSDDDSLTQGSFQSWLFSEPLGELLHCSWCLRSGWSSDWCLDFLPSRVDGGGDWV